MDGVESVGFEDSDPWDLGCGELELELAAGLAGSRLGMAVEDGWFAKAWDIGECRMSAVFFIPTRANGCDLRSAGIVVLSVSFPSLARAPLSSHGRISDFEEDAMVTEYSLRQVWSTVGSCGMLEGS